MIEDCILMWPMFGRTDVLLKEACEKRWNVNTTEDERLFSY